MGLSLEICSRDVTDGVLNTKVGFEEGDLRSEDIGRRIIC